MAMPWTLWREWRDRNEVMRRWEEERPREQLGAEAFLFLRDLEEDSPHAEWHIDVG